jgi:GNAT superfamily N-acetyltransferase
MEPMQERDEEAVVRIYEASFPPEEKEPAARMLARARAGGGLVLVERLEGEVALMAAVLVLGDTGLGLLSYYAVDERARGSGLGGASLRALAGAVRPHGIERILLEVEPPDTAIRERRIGFYLRAGARFLDADYAIPSFVDGSRYPLHLMALPGEDLEVLDGPLVTRALAAFYPDFYYCDEGGLIFARIARDMPPRVAVSAAPPARAR